MTKKMRNLRDGYSSALIELGHQNAEVVVVDADLALSTKTKRFGTIFPNRFFDFGVAEANMMGAAAGFATCGKVVFASTFFMLLLFSLLSFSVFFDVYFVAAAGKLFFL